MWLGDEWVRSSFWVQEWRHLALTRLSYELFAQEIMPMFQGTTERLQASR